MDDYYTEISDDEWEDIMMRATFFNKNDKKVITEFFSYLDSNYNRSNKNRDGGSIPSLESRFGYDIYTWIGTFKSIQISIYIYVIEDEWYIVEYINNASLQKSYKCDQIDGLSCLLEDIKKLIKK